jgi:two-component system chemotaxis sensor kinase CheA
VTRALAAEIHRAAKSALEFERKEAPTLKPGERSLMADIDADLLGQFESPLPTMEPPPLQPEVAEKATPPASLAISGPLLDADIQETDRELAQIFVSFGWEIWREIHPLALKAQREGIGRAELEACADAIRKIKNSSSYMNYRELTAFLDEWRERTLWAAERFDSLNKSDLGFLMRKTEEFEQFLRSLDETLQREPTTQAPPPSPSPSPSPVEPRRPAAPPPAKEPLPRREERKEPSGKPTEGATPSAGAPHAPAVSAPPARPAPTLVAVAPPGEEITRERPTREEPTRDLTGREKEEKEAPPEGPVVRTMRVEAAKVDVLLNQVGELVVNRSYVEQLALELKQFLRDLSGVREVGKKELQSLKDIALRVGEASLSLGRAATELQEGVMKLRMLPVGQLFNRMPRLIRDLARREGKNISLEVMGGDTEVDKRVIEQIYNPLVHLIRNAVDHGIEAPMTRKGKGKPETGVIRLSAYSQGNLVVIDVEDDGGGINHEEVVAEAVRRGIIEARDMSSFTAQEIASLLFVPGFSTSRKVTRTSGRGVGMDVVKRDVEKINGQVEIESSLGKGTRVSIKIPLTLAIIQTLLIRLGDHTFAVPLTSVREIIQTAPNELRTIEGFEVIRFRNETIPILRMHEVFKMSGSRAPRRARYVVLATTGLKTVGFPVDDLLGEQDVVIKPLAEHVWKTRGLAGSTILGDGTIALVLDVAELVEEVLFRQRQLGASGAREAENQGRNGLTSASAQ